MAEKNLTRQIRFQLEEETIRLLNKLVYWRSFPNKGQGLRPGSNPREVKITPKDYYSPKQNHRDNTNMQNIRLSAINRKNTVRRFTTIEQKAMAIFILILGSIL